MFTEENTPISTQENAPKKGFFQRYAMTFKVIIIGILTLILLIPISMVEDLIDGRERMSDAAIAEVSGKWSGPQTIIGPVLTIPFVTKGDEKEGGSVLSYLYLLPEQLKIKGELNTENLKRGLYEISVYNAPLELSGTFELPEDLSSIVLNSRFLLNQATLSVGVSDMRGISSHVTGKWGEDSLSFGPDGSGCPLLNSYLSTRVDLTEGQSTPGNRVNFNVKLPVKGSSDLMFAPVGKTTTVDLKSNCVTPSFTGEFLPESRDVTPTGFTCHWNVIDLNRNYPQIMIGNQQKESIEETTFGVSLLFPVYQYQMSMRSVKYAILIILLTFVVSLFFEIRRKISIHPFQYLLVGLALCLFYTLLVSISEHLSFTISYIIAASMTIILLTLYMLGVLKSKRSGLTLGGLLAALYGYIFVLIRLETFALLVGSVGLFLILALIMYYSQKIKQQ